MSATLSIEDAAQYLPGLSPEHKSRLYRELREMASKRFEYYFRFPEEHRLQGDSMGGSPFILFDEGNVVLRSGTSVMVLSNSCDMDPRNSRSRPDSAMVSIAPIMRVSRYAQMLLDSGANQERVSTILMDISAQVVTNVFFLPGGGPIREDSLVMLDKIQSLPRGLFEAHSPERIASLSQPAFWLLLMKMSVHFCRMHEGITRYADTEVSC